MLMETLDRRAIFSQAIEIASAEERAAYLARACGHDVALRQQVEKMVAAYFQADGADQPVAAAVNGAPHGGRDLGPAGVNHAIPAESVPHATPQPKKEEPKHSRGLKAAAALLLVATVASTSWAVLAVRSEHQAQAEAQQAADERDQARKAEAESKQQRDQALVARKAMAAERNEALESKRAALHSEQSAKAVLAFLRDDLFSVARTKGWGSAAPLKDVTLRQAVDAAEAKVAETLADRPLVEASVREILGSAYLDLGEAALAVKQYERALALREATLEEDHPAFGTAYPDAGDCRNKLAIAYRLAGRHDEASRLYDQNLHSPSYASALAVRGELLLSQKKPAEAELKLRECLAIRQKTQPDDWTTFNTKALLGEALLAQKKYAEAEPLLLAGYEGMKQREAKAPPHGKVRLTKTLERLVQLYKAWGKKDKAAQWQKELEATEAAKRS
jgi:hypothetical protein